MRFLSFTLLAILPTFSSLVAASQDEQLAFMPELTQPEVYTPGITVLVPTNKAVMALARKPHQGPPSADGDEGITITEEEFDALSKENVNRWIRAHIIPQIVSFDKPQTYATLLEGKDISFESATGSGPEWRHATLEGNIKITKMREASNGVFYMIDGTIPVYD